MTTRRYHPYIRHFTPARSTVSLFANSENIVFHGNPTFPIHVTDRTSEPTEESLDKGIEILCQKVAIGATHNSGERFDRPTCHPGTRTALQNDVYRWVDEPPGGRVITWLFGPAGAGKSAIAQTICQKLEEQGQLTASFFFSRQESASKGRGDESALVATLAYQLSLSVPPTKPLIAWAVRQNPLIFGLSLEKQIEALIVQPLTVVHQDDPGYRCPNVIVVDGLDECRKDDNAQTRVVRALIIGLTSIPHRNQKLFITSRPEHNIVAAFHSCMPDLMRKMELNDDWKPDNDIRRFLVAEFANIKRSHPYFECQPAHKTWPNAADINTLVARSSGQFIYSAVVIKYIKSEDYYDPVARLEVILQLKNDEDRPYAELDALYQHIFLQIQGVEKVEKVLMILSLERMFSANGFKYRLDFSLSLFLSYFMGAPTKEISFWLRPLVSLLTWKMDVDMSMAKVIQYFHASLPDFLANESRSDTLCIDSKIVASRIFQRALDLLEDKNMSAANAKFMLELIAIPRYYAQKLPLRADILSMFSNFNFVDNVLSQMRMTQIVSGTLETLGSYFEWILEESKTDPQKALAKPLSQIQTWIVERLAYKNVEQLNNTDHVDLWPFFTYSTPIQYREPLMPLEDLRSQIFSTTVAVQEICGLSTSSYQAARDKEVEISEDAVLFVYLMRHIPHWLADTTLLGRYAITGERYTVALLRTSRYILRLPEDQLAVFRNEKLRLFSNSMDRAYRTFSNCMSHLPLDMELYFFVLYMYSKIVNYTDSWSCRRGTALSAGAYFLSMRKKFPFLSDPASPEYIQAQEHAEATWIETKGDLYDPILSIRIEHHHNLYRYMSHTVNVAR